MTTPTNSIISLSEQDATLLNQASEKLEEYASEQRRRGNDSAAEGAECSAHAVQRLGAAMLAVQRNAQPAQAVLDSNWKARMLDGRAIERDEMGFGEHPELPMLDEGMKPRAFFAALGVELKHTMAEDDLELAEQEAMNDAGNWSAWTPRPPAGEGWRLVAIFDTEDGTAAWWVRKALAAQAAQTQRALLMSDSSKVISEKELERAFAGTDFGTADHREILHTAMLKKACEYHCGHTITEIMKELRLIGHKGALLKRGIEFLRASYHKQMLDGA